MKQAYDQIVYGASFPGVVWTTARASRSVSILLIHRYGFPGGSITESLSCLQVCEMASPRARAGEIAAMAAFQASSLQVRTPAMRLLNPEVLKYRLQKELENSPVEMLFHVLPTSMSTDAEGRTTLTLLAREGTLRVTGRSCIDASEDYSLSVLSGGKRVTRSRRMNIFITPPRESHFLQNKEVAEAVRLDDGRYWVSLKIEGADELFAEQAAQEALEQFRTSAERSGSRLQIVPVRSEASYVLERRPEEHPGLSVLGEGAGATHSPSEQVMKALIVEGLSV